MWSFHLPRDFNSFLILSIDVVCEDRAILLVAQGFIVILSPVLQMVNRVDHVLEIAHNASLW